MHSYKLDLQLTPYTMKTFDELWIKKQKTVVIKIGKTYIILDKKFLST